MTEINMQCLIVKVVSRVKPWRFPIKSKVYRLKARNASLFKETESKEVANTIINNLDKSFQSKYRTIFTAQMKKILKSCPKESKHSVAKSITKDIEEQGREAAVERWVLKRNQFGSEINSINQI